MVMSQAQLFEILRSTVMNSKNCLENRLGFGANFNTRPTLELTTNLGETMFKHTPHNKPFHNIRQYSLREYL